MKTRIKKYLSLLLIAAALTTACSCQKQEDTDSTETTPSETTPAETTEDASVNDILVADTTKGYTKIIRPEDAKTYEITAASTVNESIRSIFGSAWLSMIKDDFVKGNKNNDTVEVEDSEILIGYTNRKESRDTYDALGEDEYVVKRLNNKIVVIGKSQYATSVAATEFVEKYITGKATDKLVIPGDIFITGKCDARKVPIHADAEYRILSYNLGCAVGVANDAGTILLNYLPDIICLQECNKSIHTNVIEKLPSNYKVTTKYHENGTTYNYTPIIYDTEKLTLKEEHLEWLVGRYTGTNTKSIGYAVFETKDNKTFAVINFHGAYCSSSYAGYENMTAAERNEIVLAWRLDNVRQIIEMKDGIVKTYGDIPIMVTGDCNFNSESEPYKKITDAGFAEAEVLAKETVTGYRTSFTYGSISSAASGLSIDHIFMINGVDFVSFNSVRESIAFTASDHLPVYTDFNLSK